MPLFSRQIIKKKLLTLGLRDIKIIHNTMTHLGKKGISQDTSTTHIPI